MIIELLVDDQVYTRIETTTPELEFEIYKEIFPELTGWREQEAILPSLNESKAAKIRLFKSCRDSDELDPIATEKGVFDFDEKSLMRINEAKDALAGDSATIEWTTADNTRVLMSYMDLMQIKLAGAWRSNTLHVKYNILKAKVNACESVEELELMTWEAQDV